MLNVNDDMDELFRRAADKYPLNTGGADWEKMRQNLQDENKEDDLIVSKETRNNKWYKNLFLLLFLLPLLWICNKQPEKINNAITKNEGNINNTSRVNEGSINNTSQLRNEKRKQVPYEVETTHSNPNDNRRIGARSKLPKEASRTTASHTSSATNFSAVNKVAVKDEQVEKVSKKSIVDFDELRSITPNETPATEKKIISDRTLASTAPVDVVHQETSGKTSNDSSSSPALDKTVNSKTIKASKETIKSKSFYVGLIAIGDISTVKFQEVKEPGVGIGLLVGYQLSKKISIESGIARVKKFYYSDAKYYKSSYSSPNYKLLSVEGNCTMIDLPVNVRYNFKSKTGASWFITIGASSFVLKNEKYDYLYESWGQQMERYMNYDNSSFNPFAVINAGVGLEQQIGKTGSLRIEPNLKIPLKGMGTGKLPISSLGLNIGFIKSLTFKRSR